MLALLIIDQQQGIDFSKLGPRNNPQAQSNILSLLEHWRHLEWPVFHIRHRSKDKNSVFWPEQKGFLFKPEFEPIAGEIVIEKSVPCAFAQTQLHTLLAGVEQNGVVISGAATNNSVESTARTAGNHGYHTLVVEDACFTFEKRDYVGQLRTAEQVHAMSLANLQGEYAIVATTNQIIEIATNNKQGKKYDSSERDVPQ